MLAGSRKASALDSAGAMGEPSGQATEDRTMNSHVTPPRVGAEALEKVCAELATVFGSRFSRSASVREQHGHTLSWTANEPPDAVVFAHSTEDVATVVRLCAAHGVPIIPYGAGTSLEGHVNAPCGGVSLDVSNMKTILAVHAEDLDCVVQAGVTRKQLNDYLRDQGLFFPIDPGADASIGGMASTRASGTNAVRYGTMKDNVLSLTVVTPDGEIVRTAARAKKSSAGYDLTRLFVGAEGTLGVITEITLRLSAIPEAISAGICSFPSIRAACDAVIATIQSSLPVARIELLDTVTIKGINVYSKLSLPEQPLLLFEFHGTEAGVEEQARRFGEIAAEFGGGNFDYATRPEDRTRLWQARHDAYWSFSVHRAGVSVLSSDVCVPISRLAECVEETERDIQASGLIAPIVGHVGDGNFHCGVMVDTKNPAEVANVEAFLKRLVARALSMEGTCTGEHGVGMAKMKYMEDEHSPAALDLMRQIKRSIDPRGIMNPGKVLYM